MEEQMRKRTRFPHILAFFLLSSTAVDAQSNSNVPPPPSAPLPTWDASFSPVIVALVCAFFFIGVFTAYLHHCSDIELDAGNRTGVTANCSSSHPQGIDPTLLNTFPILVCSAIENLKSDKSAAMECAVCLSEFEHNDTLRLLPKCNHVFHPQCIDAWFASHVTCPVCRASLKAGQGDNNQVIVVIPNEVNSQEMLDESCENRLPILGRCHSTGHSLDLGGIKGKETFEDVGEHTPMSHGGLRRSASYCVFCGLPGNTSSSSSKLYTLPHL